MSLREEITPFIQGDGLVAPAVVSPSGTFRTCDNGVMFSSEYLIMLNRTGELVGQDIIDYQSKIQACVGFDNDLHRAPLDITPDEYDDHIGVLAGYSEFGLKVPFSLPMRLWRFPQLLYAFLLNKGVPSFLMPFYSFYNALVIATSCINAPTSDTDSRRLNWHQWQATKHKSMLANFAGNFWLWRQRKVYNTDKVMQAVATIYYQPPGGHPFSKYWVD